MKSNFAAIPMKMKTLFGGKALIGVDVGSWAVKVVHASSSGKPFKIQKCIIKNSTEEPVASNTKCAIESEGLLKNPAAFSISDENVESHEFSLPKLPKAELDTAIQFEIKKWLPATNDNYHDILIYRKVQGFDIQCIVSSKQAVRRCFDEGKEFGVNPNFLETESSALLACARALHAGTKMDKVAIIDLGYSSFRLIFIHEEKVSFTRSLYFGLGNLCQDAGSQLNRQPEEIMPLLRQLQPESGGASEENADLALLERLLQEMLYTLSEEFFRSEAFSKERSGFEEPQKVYLCGGGRVLSVHCKISS